MDSIAARTAPLTLAIDIGGSRLKAGVLDAAGHFVAGPDRVDTPRPATPQAVTEALTALGKGLGGFGRISIGFPGVVREGCVLTAPNLGGEVWRGFPLATTLGERFDCPARMLNDAEVQGLGAIAGKGIECVITLGTGMGFALFHNGRVAPHLELSQHPIRKGKTYDEYIGAAALRKTGPKRWNRRVARALRWIGVLAMPDALFIGGGNAKHLTIDLPPHARLVSNEAGITGGVRLWDHTLDASFAPP
jgi:polyphosphate glucokinase